MRLIYIFSLLILLLSANAATVNVGSMSRTDCVNAIASASAGDTLVFPAGTADWASTVTISKALHLQFEEGQSIVNNTSGGENTWTFIVDTPSADDNVKISGLHINGVVSGENAQGSGILVDNDQRNIRITRCSFANMRRHAVQFVGFQSWGLVDNSRFTNCYTAIEVNGDDSDSWNEPFGLGTTNCVTVENCYFENNDDTLVTDLNIVFYASNGAKVTSRHNTIRGYTTVQSFSWWDSHGNNDQEPFISTSLRGTIWAIIHDDDLDATASSNFRHYSIRGGMHVFANVEAAGNAGATCFALTEEEAWADFSYETILTVWPAPDQMTNTWIINCTYNGSPVNNAKIQADFGSHYHGEGHPLYDADTTFIQLDRDYHFANSIAETPAFDADGHPTISGGMYGVTWPVYPHPRVTAEDGGGGGSSGASDVNVTELRIGTIEVAP